MLTKKILTVALLSFLLAGGLLAQPGPGGPQGLHPMPMLRGLNLTVEQQNQVQNLRLELQKKMLAYRGDLQKLQSELRLMVIDEKTSDKQIEKQLRKIQDLRLKMAIERTKHQRKIRALLTDEQKTLFDLHFLSGQKGHKPGPPMMGQRNRMKKAPQRPPLKP